MIYESNNTTVKNRLKINIKQSVSSSFKKIIITV